MESQQILPHSNGTSNADVAVKKDRRPAADALSAGRYQGGNSSDEEEQVLSQATSPPYWVQSHQRSVSNISVDSAIPGAITLRDNTDGKDDRNQACWARGVHIDDHTIVNGGRTGIGAFVVWNITVETLDVG